MALVPTTVEVRTRVSITRRDGSPPLHLGRFSDPDVITTAGEHATISGTITSADGVLTLWSGGGVSGNNTPVADFDWLWFEADTDGLILGFVVAAGTSVKEGFPILPKADSPLLLSRDDSLGTSVGNDLADLTGIPDVIDQIFLKSTVEGSIRYRLELFT